MAEYDYHLPQPQIARIPAEPRDASRLLLLRRRSGAPEHLRFVDLPDLLEPGDCLVANETRVLRARFRARLERTGRRVEVLLSHPCPDEPGMEPGAAGDWIALLGPSRRLREGDRLLLESAAGAFEVRGRFEAGRWRLRPEADPFQMMEADGELPIPPYLNRESVDQDHGWYQTVFAREAGAIAAPTAGLHFSSGVLERLGDRGVEIARVVLHVGPGTFLPVRADTIASHQVLPERYSISESAARTMQDARRRGGRIIAIGTTVVRALETGQVRIPVAGAGWTDLTIVPGHRFAVVDGLVTNFHLPRSSLLLLVAAFAGRDRVLSAYREAVETGYRFYSYGDAMAIL